jgi:hypothetical protein
VLQYAKKNDVILLGGGRAGLLSGASLIRSVDGGLTWSLSSAFLRQEVASIEVSASRWVAVGSRYYSFGSAYNDVTTPPADTIIYSDNEGETWSLASTPFDVAASLVVYDGTRLVSNRSKS